MLSASSEPAGDEAPGFRLHKLEVFNWGTFHQKAWSMKPEGQSSLLIGEQGSGKSTLVDALTTLLSPPRKITFNKAAGAESGERSLGSYVRGEYKAVRNDYGEGRKAEALRSENSYSVLLATFHHVQLALSVTLAQVFWLREGQRTPERFYLTAESNLRIPEHFSGFGGDPQELRKRLRKTGGVKVHDSFMEYALYFRRLLGIPGEQALELFYQTISMKSVGNLTSFVRAHMLEAAEVETHLKKLRERFENLNEAHEAVRRARLQIEHLRPIKVEGEKYTDSLEASAWLKQLREALSPYYATLKAGLLTQRIRELESEKSGLEARSQRERELTAALQQELDGIRAAILQSGGGRIAVLEGLIAEKLKTRSAREDKEKQFRALASNLGLTPAKAPEEFVHLRLSASTRAQTLQNQEGELYKQEIAQATEFKKLGESADEVRKELESLRQRRSNIPHEYINLRAELAKALAVDEADLPFVGELLQVLPEQAAWEGALERLLGAFAMSLLVADAHYARVSEHVNQTHLGLRLVYLRVQADKARSRWTELSLQAAARKLQIKNDSLFQAFLQRELAERYDHNCCESLEQFRRLSRAITQQGQIKSSERQHEKDDRRNLLDRRHYVLGWSNREKIKALESDLKRLQKQQQGINAEREKIKASRKENGEQLRAVDLLLAVTNFVEIDWWSAAREIHSHEDEKQQIENSSDRLKTLREQEKMKDAEIASANTAWQRTLAEIGAKATLIQERQSDLADAQVEAVRLSGEHRDALIVGLDEWRNKMSSQSTLDLRGIDARQRELRDALNAEIDSRSKQADRAAQRLIGLMKDYKTVWPTETAEMDDSPEALPEYLRRLTGLEAEDLPRHEERFKKMLREDTIGDMAAFSAQLNGAAAAIKKNIQTINRPLSALDYNEGTYIELTPQDNTDPELRQFRQDLRACISQAGESEPVYSEEKFLQVKALMDRFAGRAGKSDEDVRWKAKVTDVRNWFEFAVEEKWKVDGKHHEWYADSSGKSGGQKEKLAYTILAAALAYQFGLHEENVGSRQRLFRFVVIDEAFGRGSPGSARYGLELFRRLGLQLLVVTPLEQKTHIIEDYIGVVHFVHNREGRASSVLNLPIEKYREMKAARQLLAAAATPAA